MSSSTRWRKSLPAIARVDVAVQGGSLAVFRLGDPNPVRAPAKVLAVHGITANSRAWLAVARRLEGRAELLVPDLRGRGASNALGPPYGMGAHARDMLAVLDHFGLERSVVVGHSLGAYILARFAVEHPERVSSLVLVDGGLTLPETAAVDPQRFLDAFLGPALARLRLTFGDRAEYHDWWRAHPAITGSDIAVEDLVAYADHDLTGEEPNLRSAVSEKAVRGDAEELFEMGGPTHRLTLPALLLCAPRGLLNEPNPMQPMSVVNAWAAEAPELRRAISVPDVNHYTIVMGDAGARVLANSIAEAIGADP
jgi:pimeloyl-ACP methyl ester carboxylesterase